VVMDRKYSGAPAVNDNAVGAKLPGRKAADSQSVLPRVAAPKIIPPKPADAAVGPNAVRAGSKASTPIGEKDTIGKSAANKDSDGNGDRRGVQRTKVLRNAKIIVPQRSPVIHCTVQNITDGGACLTVANTFGVPQTFDLTFEHGRTRRACRVIWRTHDKLGVTFAGEEKVVED
jgi:PilZ domain